MPVLIEGGADLVLIAGILVCIGMLMAVQHTFVPMLRAVANFDTHIPGLRKPFAGIGNRVVNSINNALGAAITASQKSLAGLFAGLVWSIRESAKAVTVVAQDMEDALSYLVNRKIPEMIDAQIRHAELVATGAVTTATNAASAAVHALSEAQAFTRGQILKVEREIDSAADAARAYAATNIAAAATALTHNAALLVHDLDNRLSDRIDRIEGTVESKVAASIAAAERAAKAAIGDAIENAIDAGGVIDRDIKRVVNDAIAKALASGLSAEAAVGKAIDAAIHDALASSGAIETRVQADIAKAVGAIVTVGGVTLPQVQDLINRAVAAASQAGGVSLAQVQDLINRAVAGAISTGSNIGQLVDDVRRQIEDEIANLDVGDVAAISAAAAALTATVTMTLAETGLDRAECRSKVKGICGTDSGDWSGLLTGITAFGLGISLAEVVLIGQEMIGDIANVGDDLGGIL